MLEETKKRGEHTIADKGFDSDAIREKIEGLGSKPVISFNATEKPAAKLKKRFYRQ